MSRIDDFSKLARKVTVGQNTFITLDVSAVTVNDNAIITEKILNSAVTTDKINDLAVVNDKIAEATIANSKLVYDSITIGDTEVELGDTVTAYTGLTSITTTSISTDTLTVDTSGSIPVLTAATSVQTPTIFTDDPDTTIYITPYDTGVIKVPSGYELRSEFDTNSLVNKKYVDYVASGLDIKQAVRASTTAALTATYNNGSSGIGATLTASSNETLSIDGITTWTTTSGSEDRVLVKDQLDQTQNGIYIVTDAGSPTTQWVLTRATDADQGREIDGGSFFLVKEGTSLANNGFVASHNNEPDIGNDNITFTQFSGAGLIDPGSALSSSGNTINVNTDDTTIEVNAQDKLQVKDNSITSTQLANTVTLEIVNSSGQTIKKLYGAGDPP